MINKLILVVTLLVFVALYAGAQNSKAFYESVVRSTDDVAKRPIVLPQVDPADIVWAKTLWREVILREKMNLPLYYPTKPIDGRMSLIDVMMQGHRKKSYKNGLRR